MMSMKLSNFEDLPPPVHVRPNFSHPLDLGRLIFNDPPPPTPLPLSNKLWNNSSIIHVNE